jgi:hypothetical protein
VTLAERTAGGEGSWSAIWERYIREGAISRTRCRAVRVFLSQLTWVISSSWVRSITCFGRARILLKEGETIVVGRLRLYVARPFVNRRTPPLLVVAPPYRRVKGRKVPTPKFSIFYLNFATTSTIIYSLVCLASNPEPFGGTISPHRMPHNTPAGRVAGMKDTAHFNIVARRRQVYIEWLEMIVFTIYLSEEKRTPYRRPTYLGFGSWCLPSWTFSYPYTVESLAAESLRTGE